MNKKTISTIKYSIFFLFGMILIYLVFKDADLTKMMNDLKHADYKWVLASFLLGYFAYVSRGYRWLLLLEPMGYKPKPINSVNSISITYFTNLILPRAGEIARATSLNQSEGIPVDKLLGTIVIERIIDMIILLFIIFSTVILRYNDLTNFFYKITSNSHAGEGESHFAIYFFTIIIILSFVAFILRNRIKTTSIYDKIRSFLSGVKEGVKTIKHMKSKGLFVFHTFFIWLMYYLMVYVVFFAIPETMHLTVLDGLFILVVGALGMIAPVPGGIGAYHGAVMIGLNLLGIPLDTALGFAVIVHTTQTLIALISGPIAIVMTSIEKKKRLQKINI